MKQPKWRKKTIVSRSSNREKDVTVMKQQSNVGPFALKPDPPKESAKRGNKKLNLNEGIVVGAK